MSTYRKRLNQTKHSKSKWRDEYYVQINDLAKTGMTKQMIRKTLGIDIKTFDKWLVKRPVLQTYLDNAKRNREEKTETQRFIDYVYEQLPEHLKEIWDDISDIENEPNSIKRIEFILSDHGDRVRQHLFMHALVHTNFNISKALKKVNITRRMFQRWIDTDPDFPDLIEEINFHKKNFFEAALVGLVHAGDTAAILFANKTLNRDRGYGEKTEVTVNGNIEHAHVVTVDSLNLPIETRQQVLDAIRAKRIINVAPQRLLEQESEGEDDGDSDD